MSCTNKGLWDLGTTSGLYNKNDCIFGIFNVPIQHVEIVTAYTDCTYGSNVLPSGNNSGNTGNSMKIPWLCMLCKMCDVRVCIVLMIMIAIAFMAIIIAIVILMN